MTARQIAGLVLRLVALALVVWGAILLGEAVREALGLEVLPHNEALVYRTILFSVLVYALLLALPFVPGAEIGLTLFAVFGASVAPLIYGATVAGLCLAFVVGRLIPPEATCRLLRRLGMDRTAALIEKTEAAPTAERGTVLLSGIDSTIVLTCARYRYLALALLINTPGNVVLGGGGGLSLMAGLSRSFSPLGFLLTSAIAVAPVPVAVMVFGVVV